MNPYMLKRHLYACFYVVVFSTVFFSCNKELQHPPNVIFILVDDLGWTDLQSYGSTYHQTPAIDKLAKNGVMFTNAYTASTVCSPTRASILTGKYPASLKLTDFIPGKVPPEAKLDIPEWKKYLDTSEVTMAKIFKSNAYVTGHIGKWHLGEDSIYWPENNGFDINIGGWSRGAPLKNLKKGVHGYFSPYGNPRLNDGEEGEYLTDRLAEEVTKFIEENKDKPFFLNYWPYAVHLPLQAREEKIAKYAKLVDTLNTHQNPVYAAMVEHVDDAIHSIVSTLKKVGIEDNTILVFTSDNGGLVGNHSRFTEEITSNYPLRSGKGDMYEGGIRVPCIVYYPKKIKPRVDDTPTISADFLPTLIELTGIENKHTTNFEGVSLASLLLENKALEPRPLFWHHPHYHTEGAVPHSAIRDGDYKLIHNIEADSLELYNLSVDSSESNNLIESHSDTAQLLFEKLQYWKSSVNAQEPIAKSAAEME